MNNTVNRVGLGKLIHLRNVTSIVSSEQTQAVRMNRDTLYSYGVFDLTSPVKFELPVSAGLYMSFQAIDEEHFTLAFIYPHNSKTTKIIFTYNQNITNNHDSIEVASKTRYMYIIIRILVNPYNRADLQRGHVQQNLIKLTQAGLGEFLIPNWNKASIVNLQAALTRLADYIKPGTSLTAYRGQIDPTVQLIGVATLWGGIPLEYAYYQLFYPPELDLNSVGFYIRVRKSVPIKPTGFWSITVYNSNDRLEFNPYDSYSHNSLTAKPEADGSYFIYFSAVKRENMTNWIFIFPGWNYMVRIYEPEDVIINNEWSFPPLNKLDDFNSATTILPNFFYLICLLILCIKWIN